MFPLVTRPLGVAILDETTISAGTAAATNGCPPDGEASGGGDGGQSRRAKRGFSELFCVSASSAKLLLTVEGTLC